MAFPVSVNVAEIKRAPELICSRVSYASERGLMHSQSGVTGTSGTLPGRLAVFVLVTAKV